MKKSSSSGAGPCAEVAAGFAEAAVDLDDDAADLPNQRSVRKGSAREEIKLLPHT